MTGPPQAAVTSLRPDLVLWSSTQRRVYVVELTVPWEDAVQEAFERKRNRYSACSGQQGWDAKIYPVDVDARGSSQPLLLS